MVVNLNEIVLNDKDCEMLLSNICILTIAVLTENDCDNVLENNINLEVVIFVTNDSVTLCK